MNIRIYLAHKIEIAKTPATHRRNYVAQYDQCLVLSLLKYYTMKFQTWSKNQSQHMLKTRHTSGRFAVHNGKFLNSSNLHIT